MPPAARKTDNVLHDAPHCHGPIHPPGSPVPAPVPHPPMPLPLMLNCVENVLINNLAAAIVTTMTKPCMLATCLPGGPGAVAVGSSSVMIRFMPAARLGDMVMFPVCIAPIPSPTGKIIPPCSPNVIVGG